MKKLDNSRLSRLTFTPVKLILVVVALLLSTLIQANEMKTNQTRKSVSHEVFLSETKKQPDLTQFDYPFLIGDWYWFAPQDKSINHKGTDYKAISLKFNSDYHYYGRLLTSNNIVERWQGIYRIDDDMITFIRQGSDNKQQYQYRINHNKIQLGKAVFTKVVPKELSGQWYSATIKSEEQEYEQINLNLGNNFIFSVEVIGENGKKVMHEGVYFYEDEQLVMLYKGGQQLHHFTIENNQLNISNLSKDISVVMTRQQ
ncbi:hypothetical protein L0B53_13785 [Vibrio sp. SS-MA-C1-2]|uniref:hypothetical protein n=1 Tax=Vibrio sp. SS-MA-C1-2 TaxID=2908646 RepID=UPI001F15E997|nr:hypothetical protein [Vibrio sp. SS-MA-C1-2]UJF18085.1 hypothetical protein L0B53_13785 [Vibrio sp. SS-MA-C1-2]